MSSNSSSVIWFTTLSSTNLKVAKARAGSWQMCFHADCGGREKMPGTVEARNGHKYRPPLWANQRNKQKWMKQTIGNHLVL